MADMDTHIFTFDVFVTETADFTDTQAGRIHECDHSLLLEARYGGDTMQCILFRRDKREMRIELAHRKLKGIPRIVKVINGEETQLGDGDIDGVVG